MFGTQILHRIHTEYIYIILTKLIKLHDFSHPTLHHCTHRRIYHTNNCNTNSSSAKLKSAKKIVTRHRSFDPASIAVH